MRDGNLESLAFEREVSDGIIEEDILALQSILFDIKTTTFRASVDDISEDMNANIERKLKEENVRQKYRDLVANRFMLTVLEEYPFTKYYGKSEFESAHKWLAHRNTTLMIVPDVKETQNYFKKNPKRPTRLVEMPHNHPIPVWPIGKKFDVEAKTWRYMALTKGWNLKRHYLDDKGALNLLDAFYYPEDEFSDYDFNSSLRTISFTSSSNIPLLRNDYPTNSEVQEAYDSKSEKFIFDNQPLTLQQTMPIVNGLSEYGRLTEEDMWRYDIARNVANIYSLRNTGADGVIDWQKFDDTLHRAKKAHDFISTVALSFFETKKVKDYFNLRTHWGETGSLFAPDEEKARMNGLLKSKKVQVVINFIEYFGEGTLGRFKHELKEAVST